MASPSLIAATLLYLLAYVYPDQPMHPSPQLVGEWHGTAHVLMARLLGTQFPVRITIHPDGTVTGQLGDGRLVAAHFLRHRPQGATQEQRHDLVEFMIRGTLAGSLLAAQHVTAAEVFIPLDYDRGKLVGAVHAHKTKIAGESLGIFSSDLTLAKAPR